MPKITTASVAAAKQICTASKLELALESFDYLQNNPTEILKVVAGALAAQEGLDPFALTEVQRKAIASAASWCYVTGLTIGANIPLEEPVTV